MCGRFVQEIDPATLRDRFGVLNPPNVAWRPRYNLAPGQPATILVAGRSGPEVEHAVWGLIPAWASPATAAHKLINARIETIWSKPAFRDAARYRRCLVPASGFYEWVPGSKGRAKIPYYFHRPTVPCLALAGLWAVWNDREGGECVSFAIITRPADVTMRPYHARMPLILHGHEEAVWLDQRRFRPTDLAEIAVARDVPLTGYPVAAKVNNVRVDEPACCQRVPLAVQATWSL